MVADTQVRLRQAVVLHVSARAVAELASLASEHMRRSADARSKDEVEMLQPSGRLLDTASCRHVAEGSLVRFVLAPATLSMKRRFHSRFFISHRQHGILRLGSAVIIGRLCRARARWCHLRSVNKAVEFSCTARDTSAVVSHLCEHDIQFGCRECILARWPGWGACSARLRASVSSYSSTTMAR